MILEEKIKHLEFIQSVINRMAHNSFVLKGWTITIIAALFALAAKETNSNYLLLAFFPALMFWLLDGYYLAQERQFRALYNDAIQPNTKVLSFSMNTSKYKTGKNTWFKAFFSRTIILFHFPIVFVIGVIIVLMYSGFTFFKK